jgi:hypothetical protein
MVLVIKQEPFDLTRLLFLWYKQLTSIFVILAGIESAAAYQ